MSAVLEKYCCSLNGGHSVNEAATGLKLGDLDKNSWDCGDEGVENKADEDGRAVKVAEDSINIVIPLLWRTGA